MNTLQILIAIGINAIFFFGIYYLLRKFSKYLKQRILLPNRNIKSYLEPIDEIYENKIKKSWLVSFILLNTVSFLSTVAILWKIENLTTPSKIVIISSTLFVFAISIYITYYCAYMKRGTALLLYILIVSPFSQIYNTFLQVTNKTAILLPNWLQIILLTLLIFYWIQSLLLRNVNLKRRHHKDAMYLKHYFESTN
jgi:hypothetical protein